MEFLKDAFTSFLFVVLAIPLCILAIALFIFILLLPIIGFVTCLAHPEYWWVLASVVFLGLWATAYQEMRS